MTVEEYFKKVVYEYNCGDVKLLLARKLNACGPLLASTMNGIDLVGGMMLGFGPGNSQARSKKFMVDFLQSHDAVAAMLYNLFRCGITHEGTTKLKTFFFVNYDAPDDKDFIARKGDLVLLDVTALARKYVAAIEGIRKDINKFLFHVPSSSPKDDNAYAAGLPNVTELPGEQEIRDFLGWEQLKSIEGYSGFSGYPQITGSGGAHASIVALESIFPGLRSIHTT